ncbi:DNA modification methylase [Rhizobium azooxidifex]|uniref:Methyltransferase n=2 Tax=Mycoplana azooxidifex TaxID=1636188 RepID=A0A7W6DBF0_9HYPH|nr:DNA modification methylase [Mycoplana azooxidifex]
MAVQLHHADCRDVLRGIGDNTIDSVVTDPPYALVSIQKRFGKPGSAPAKDVYGRGAAGFMGKQWDTGEVAFSEEFWAEVLRVLKPGGHVVAFSGTRTYHRMAVAIEDAGFEIRDQLGWVYGSGFPKSHDVSRDIDKKGGNPLAWRAFSAAYAEAVKMSTLTHSNIDRALGIKSSSCYWARLDGRGGMPPRHHWDVVRDMLSLPPEMERLYDEAVRHDREVRNGSVSGSLSSATVEVLSAGTPVTAASRQWQGWGTALKPAWEPICLARKPLIGTVAENVLEHGTGAINIDGSRVPGGNEHTLGRWPANIVHDGSDEVISAFPDTKSGNRKAGEYGLMGYHGADTAPMPAIDGDSGSAARFFYCAKASRADRDAGLFGFEPKADTAHRRTNLETADRPHLRGLTKRANTHPTVKPTSLMQWLCRLITPPGGVILDPFMGSGSTGKAAVLEGFQFVGCEREDEYMPVARARIAAAGLEDML